MPDPSTAAFWIAVLQIILIDILLGGDNAVLPAPTPGADRGREVRR